MNKRDFYFLNDTKQHIDFCVKINDNIIHMVYKPLLKILKDPIIMHFLIIFATKKKSQTNSPNSFIIVTKIHLLNFPYEQMEIYVIIYVEEMFKQKIISCNYRQK